MWSPVVPNPNDIPFCYRTSGGGGGGGGAGGGGGGGNVDRTSTRFMSFNVYYAGLASTWRVEGIVDAIRTADPEIASIQEMWHEKPQILARLNAKENGSRSVTGSGTGTGRRWRFATGGRTETTWDGDILYRDDVWTEVESGLEPYGDRGLNWAVLRRRADGVTVIAMGTHPWCCTNDVAFRVVRDTIIPTIERLQQRHPHPVALMGDFNSDWWRPSGYLLRDGHHGSTRISVSFEDSGGSLKHQSTIGTFPKIDFVYFQNSPATMALGKAAGGKIWCDLPGGSDHCAVTGDVRLFS